MKLALHVFLSTHEKLSSSFLRMGLGLKKLKWKILASSSGALYPRLADMLQKFITGWRKKEIIISIGLSRLSSPSSCWRASKVPCRTNSKNSSASLARYINSISSGIKHLVSAGTVLHGNSIVFSLGNSIGFDHCFFESLSFSGGAALSPTSAVEMLWRHKTDFTMWKPFLGWVTPTLFRAQF